jgi:hypothetical protein
MAYDDIALLAGIAVFLVILAIVLFLIFNNRISPGNRMRLIRVYKGAPRKTAGAPVLVHGPAGSSGVVMPAGGEPVAFHATFIMSNDCTLIRTPGDRQPLPSGSSFKVFTTSGDFTVSEAGVPYTISIVSALERFSEGGAAIFTANQKMNAVLDGMPESVFDDMVTFEAAIKALAGVFTLSVTGKTVTSSINSRVSIFTQGRDVPAAIAEMLRQKIIRPEPGTEITVTEFFIPLKKSVFAFGTFDGVDTVLFGDTATGLSVSYGDPETEGA